MNIAHHILHILFTTKWIGEWTEGPTEPARSKDHTRRLSRVRRHLLLLAGFCVSHSKRLPHLDEGLIYLWLVAPGPELQAPRHAASLFLHWAPSGRLTECTATPERRIQLSAFKICRHIDTCILYTWKKFRMCLNNVWRDIPTSSWARAHILPQSNFSRSERNTYCAVTKDSRRYF